MHIMINMVCKLLRWAIIGVFERDLRYLQILNVGEQLFPNPSKYQVSAVGGPLF